MASKLSSTLTKPKTNRHTSLTGTDVDSPAYDASEEDNDPLSDDQHHPPTTRIAKKTPAPSRRHQLAQSILSDASDGVDSPTYDGDVEEVQATMTSTLRNHINEHHHHNHSTSSAASTSTFEGGGGVQIITPGSASDDEADDEGDRMAASMTLSEPAPAAVSAAAFNPAALTPEDVRAYVQAAIDGEAGRAYKINPPPEDRPARIYSDGVYDLFHFGHALQLRQAKLSFPSVYLLVGVNSDEQVREHKARGIMSHAERLEAVRHCRWVDEVVADAPWIIDQAFLDAHQIDYVAHDEVPYAAEGHDDVYAFVKQQGKFIPTRRTPGVSTSELLERIVSGYRHRLFDEKLEKMGHGELKAEGSDYDEMTLKHTASPPVSSRPVSPTTGDISPVLVSPSLPSSPSPGPHTSLAPHTPGYTPKVSFDTFENPAASMFSFTLQVKSAGYAHTRNTRVFLCAAGPDESGREALDWSLEGLCQDGDELIVCRGVDDDAFEKDHNSVREEARQLMLHIQEKSVEYDPDRRLSLILEFIPGRITNTLDRLIALYRPDSVVVGTRGKRAWQTMAMMGKGGIGSVSKYCLTHSPVPIIVVRPERKVKKGIEKRRADPKRGTHFFEDSTGKPYNITNSAPLGLTVQAPPPQASTIQLESPTPILDDEGLDLAADHTLLDSPDALDDDEGDIAKSLERLEVLRKNVQKNLRLRPIRSAGSLPKVQLALGDSSPWDPSFGSPGSTLSAYFTPDGPPSARFLGPPSREPRPVGPASLMERLSQRRRPLLIDTRPQAAHFSFHIRHSINLAIPSLILKRSKKNPFQSLDALKQYVTTDQGKRDWDALLAPNGPWDGDVVVYGEDEDQSLLPILAPLIMYGSVDYLQGGISKAGHELESFIVSGGEAEPQNNGGGGLFQLDTSAASRSKPMPEIDTRSSMEINAAQAESLTAALPAPPRSPLPLMSSIMSSNAIDTSPSPAPGHTGFHRPPPPPRRPSAPNLRKLDTKSAERLKLSVRTMPLRANTTALAPPSPGYASTSPSTPWTLTSPVSGIGDMPTAYFTPPHTPGTPRGGPNGFNFSFAREQPATARPDEPPTTEEPVPEFAISTILPGFLFLGPELTQPEHVAELQSLGVRRILNLAIECDDDHGLNLRTVFKYHKIAMRDTVEEENIARGVREVCEVLDDARLHSAGTYVHCKAGKSRSVTAVMAYLIHANHWTLSRAYAFVLERRKGISPNIGFVSELMTFEEEELGGKSIGVQPTSAAEEASHSQGHHPGAGHAHNANYNVAVGGRRGGHIRESLPPIFSQSQSFSAVSSDGPEYPTDEAVGNVGQEIEVRNAAGQYRHARRAPVNETTLQPMRRVSKAGLESAPLVS
ncbi:hypothetical protein MKEN_01349600 [Mycena kentingensis (nom. inval.)]|nr:hypothetical protein MKEN_01349600 [Mycena kentingensis (nom. inval.)]